MKKIVIKIFLVLISFFVFGNYVFANDYIYYLSSENDKIYHKNVNDNTDGIAISDGVTLRGFPINISPDGQYLLYTKNDNLYRLYRKNVNDNTNGIPITTTEATYGVYSPNGDYIYYVGLNDNKIYKKNANDTNNGIAISDGVVDTFFGGNIALSPNGNYIIYSNVNDGKLYKKNVNDNGNGINITSSIGLYPSFSLDGTYIYYSNNDNGNKIYRKSANDNNDGVAIINNEGFTPVFSTDLQYIYYTNTNDRGKIYRKNANDNTSGTPINSQWSYSLILYSDNSLVNGTCGTNAISYLSGSTNYTGTFCSAGTPNPPIPSFPLPGQTVSWTCEGSNSGTTANCSATKEPLSNVPTNLKQEVQSPELPRDDIPLGGKIGKFQSGSGIVLSANISDFGTGQVRLKVELYQSGQTNPIKTFTGSYISGGISEIIIPYSSVGSGEYSWRAKAERNDGASSDGVNFDANNTSNYDFGYFEGFEPYPYGYRFKNSLPASGLLTGGISNFHFSYPFHYREKVDGTRWEIFNTVYPEWKFDSEEKMLAKFEEGGFDNDEPYSNGSCFGLAFTAGMQYKQPGYMSFNFNNFSNQVGTGYIWNKINPILTDNNGKWNEDNITLRTILTSQIYQFSQQFSDLKDESVQTLSGVSIINEVKNNPQKTFILTIYGKKNDKDYVHAVVPYRTDGNRIYIWDNEYPYTNYTNVQNAYNQYLELNNNGKWISNTHIDVDIEKISLVNILDIDDLNLIAPAGFNGTDQSFTLVGNSDLLVRDSLGRVSGFQNGNILEEIPGVNVVIPYNTIGEENTFKKIYVPQKKDLKVIVTGRSSENYKLMIAGGDYYTKIDGVSTTIGQIDSFIPRRENLKIDFDNSKTGSYNLLVDNFNNGTGTVYMEGIPSIGEKQNYDINWNKVINDDNDAVAYSMDIDNDGNYENEQFLPSKYQYVIPSMMKSSPTGSKEENEDK